MIKFNVLYLKIFKILILMMSEKDNVDEIKKSGANRANQTIFPSIYIENLHVILILHSLDATEK